MVVTDEMREEIKNRIKQEIIDRLGEDPRNEKFPGWCKYKVVFFKKERIVYKDGKLQWDYPMKYEELNDNDIEVVSAWLVHQDIMAQVKNKEIKVSASLFNKDMIKMNRGLCDGYPHGCESETNLRFILKHCLKEDNIDSEVKFKHDLYWMEESGLVDKVKKNTYKLNDWAKALLYKFYIKQGGVQIFHYHKFNILNEA